jgi:hypothetical protein
VPHRKQVSRAQNARGAAALERADIVKEQMQVKVAKSVERLKTVRDCRKDWEV